MVIEKPFFGVLPAKGADNGRVIAIENCRDYLENCPWLWGVSPSKMVLKFARERSSMMWL
jgi:hypothetical protein